MSITFSNTPAFPVAESSFSLPIVLQFPAGKRMTADEYFEFCMANPELRLEQSSTGEIVIMAPTGADSGDRNAEITMQLRVWAKKDGTGKSFDSNTEFCLPNNSARCPDASWILLMRWNALSKKEQQQFPPLCPDFVLELRSYSDRLKPLQEKMEEYLANGARLGWLVDPYSKQVHVYRPNQEPEILNDPKTVSGESVLPGFELDLAEIFPQS